MRKGSSSHAFVRASIGSQTQTWGMSISQACHLASGAQRLGDAYGGHYNHPQTRSSRLFITRLGEAGQTSAVPSPLPLTSRLCV